MSDATRMLRSCAADEWRSLAVAAVATLAVVVSYLARPLPLALAVDQILDRGVPFELTTADWRLLLALAGLVLAIVLLNTLGSHVADDRLENAAERIVHRLRVATYSRLQRLSLAFHERRDTGNLVSHVTGDVNAVGSLFADSLGGVVSAGMLLLGMLTVSLIVDPLVAVSAFAAAPALAFISLRYQPRVRALAKRRRAVAGEIASLSDESLSSVRAVKALGGESFEEERLERKSAELQRISRESNRVEGRMSILVDSLGALALALVVVVGVLRAAAGAISIGELIILYTYARRIDRPLRGLARTVGKASRYLARAERIAEIFASDELVEDRPGAFSGARASGEIELRGVGFSYDPERPAIAGMSLRVPAGQRVALVGPSGAGKSTVAALMARLYDPDEGQALIDGLDARDCSVAWLREQFGLVLQETILFTGTVAENIAYGVDEASPEAVVAAARAAGADGFIAELPAGYDTMLGPQAVALSGGQRQRIAIARTLLRDPAVLILDEPTTGLDAVSEAAVLAGLEELMRGRTTILITHSHRLARTAERVVMVDGGRIADDGSPQDVLAHEAPPPAGAARSERIPVPRDPVLPRMPDVLDPEVMADVLGRSLGEGAGRPDVRVRYLRYRPEASLVVHYDVDVGARRHQATAMIARYDLARRARKPANVALADTVDGRSPASRPLLYEPALGALVQWLPLDLSLPGLVEPPARLRWRLRDAGLPGALSGPEPALLAYRPRRRAVLRVDDRVLKAYASESRYRAAETRLRAVSGGLGVPTAAFEIALPDLRVTVQSFLPGRDAGPARALAGAAGLALHELHRSPVARLDRLPPAGQLAAAAATGQLVAAIAPRLAGRVDALVRRLARALPEGLPEVPCHGDFHAGQLLCDDGGLALIDFDEMASAPPALDLGTYAAHELSGDGGDLAAARAIVEELVEGYGSRPEGIDWYLSAAALRRASHPFRRLRPDWPERVEALVAAAESALAR
jgi:ATP-binding cassette subfamily B protein/subfamily B ATP-binding cassette protein MsbA